MADDLCIHDLIVGTCATCLHGPEPKVEATQTCRSCQAEILWVVTQKGKRMPLDVEPSEEGTFVKDRIDENGDKRVRFVPEGERATIGKPLYTTHFVTCPDSALHRKT